MTYPDKIKEAYEYGREIRRAHDFGNFDVEAFFLNFVQDADYVNNVLPELRRIAGYEDAGMGTYTVVPEGKNENRLDTLYDDLVAAFWEGVMNT